MNVTIMTYNMHKGFSVLGQRLVVHEMRDALHEEDPDLVFLQEVTGASRKHRSRYADQWPDQAQHEYLASDRWQHHRYVETRNHRHGHHGNAILSKFPILTSEGQDISVIPFEQRALLYCEIQAPHWDAKLHCICVHLSLLKWGRTRQYNRILEIVDQRVPKNHPLIIAGDFNDWRTQANKELAGPMNLREVFLESDHGAHATSFPAQAPLLRLDRIYVRGLDIHQANVHVDGGWHRLSDHVPLSANLQHVPSRQLTQPST